MADYPIVISPRVYGRIVAVRHLQSLAGATGSCNRICRPCNLSNLPSYKQFVFRPGAAEFDARPAQDDQLKMILRAGPSGSFTIRQSLSHSMVLSVSGSVASHWMPGMLGWPLAAKAAQQAAMFLASL
jgi:hypothetical protein